MELGAKQRQFVIKIAELIQYAYAMGYEMTFGDAYRDPRLAELNAQQGKGIKNSLHTKRLAIDLNLFKGGVYLQNSEDHKPLGEYWESIGGTWGGRFSKPDGNHYSFEWEGIK